MIRFVQIETSFGIFGFFLQEIQLHPIVLLGFDDHLHLYRKEKMAVGSLNYIY
jgi:hypothetical protein